jgi:peptidoglycan/xylan/chitin deacetylase (PgdA/CDA1 family)
MIKDDKSFNAPTIAVTIDDGYLNSYTLAYPVIRQYKVPVMIYLTAGLIGTNKGLWLDEIEFSLRHARVKNFSLAEVFGEEEVDISTVTGKRTALKMFYVALLPSNNDVRTRIAVDLRLLLLVADADLLNRDRIMLNWDEVKEMAANGVLCGAHTLTHPFLPTLPLEEAQEEISTSRKVIEERTGRKARHFAIPNGTRNDFSENLTAFCRESGFCSVVTTEGGAVRSGDDLFALKRVLPPSPIYFFACEVSRYLFTW